MSDEDRYEALDMIIKVREDGQTWFDIISDLITETCEGDPDSIENSCTCGLEAMGGTTGTLDQCYRHQGIADDIVGPVSKEDLLKVLRSPAIVLACASDPELEEAAARLMKECTWWDDIQASMDEDVVEWGDEGWEAEEAWIDDEDWDGDDSE